VEVVSSKLRATASLKPDTCLLIPASMIATIEGFAGQ
jgi:hypothetical protein